MILPVSKGLTAYNFAWYGGMVVVLALFVYLGIPYGSLSVAIALVLMRLVLYFPSWYYFGQGLAQVTFMELLRANFFPITNFWKGIRKRA